MGSHHKGKAHPPLTEEASLESEGDPIIDAAFSEVDSDVVTMESLLEEYQRLQEENEQLKARYAGEEQIRTAAEKKYHDRMELRPYAAELNKLQQHLDRTGRGMIVLVEGRDGSGKGGVIRRITRYMNPKHYRVVALGKPNEHQRTQWYFQRFVQHCPHGGELVLFDRSWYNRAMVEPVFGFCTEEQYQNFMQGVVSFEHDLVLNGLELVKIYLSVSREVQTRRFEKRRVDPLHSWKLTEMDLMSQDRWDDFTLRKYEMLKRTHTSEAPWTIVRADDKQQARVNVMRVLLNAINYEDRNPDLSYVPDPHYVYSGAYELELMADKKRRGGDFSG
ncbi:polyphosphate kinase 2 [Magnetofaba australis]|uniref:ADP/GDP-polyphosphate phosphotransferase n=1 Tax=Magnetofaba australis IT-1 TaxID=1434232 RepID=A0A1Y2K566_9PROT|nr:polyphosphate kinase 2 [Magnetofaba australis]OSM02155.1 putative polyphosphate kinase 2 [Magnetofaba australis IT-1]